MKYSLLIVALLSSPATVFAQDTTPAPVATPAPAAQETPAPVATPAPADKPASTYASDNIAPPTAGKGQLIVFRRGGFAGSAISCAVFESGKKLSSLPPGKFAVIDIDPGLHNFTVRSEATDIMRVEVEAGKSYYAQCTIAAGFFAGRPQLTPTDKSVFFAMGPKLKPVEKKPE